MKNKENFDNLGEINKDCDSFKVTRIIALRPEHFYIEVEEA